MIIAYMEKFPSKLLTNCTNLIVNVISECYVVG